MEQHERFQGLQPESQGHNPALTVLHVPESGLDCLICLVCEGARSGRCGCSEGGAGLGEARSPGTAFEPTWNSIKSSENFHPSQGQNLALPVLHVPESGLDCLICLVCEGARSGSCGCSEGGAGLREARTPGTAPAPTFSRYHPV